MNEIKEDNTEEKILEAAEKLFLEKGFALTSTTEIAKVVGVNQAMVHYYFRKKENLFEAIFEKKLKLLVSTFFSISEEDIPFEEKLKKKIELHFDMLKENRNIPFLIINEFCTNPDRLKSIKEKVKEFPIALLKQIEKEIKIEVNERRLRPTNPADLLISVISLNVMLFLALPIFKQAIEMSDDEIEEFLEHRKQENVRIILNSLKP